MVPHGDSTGGAGVMFHTDRQNEHFIEFNIDTDGHWSLAYYKHVDDHASDNWNYLNEGFSSAIRKGLGAQNTILYVQRGRHITVYVNGQQVDSDDFTSTYYGDLPMEGFPGIYSDQAAMDTAFTDFLVYRLPAPPDFWTALLGADSQSQ
jgi:hypothetical protein